jgi:hypothetical protein
LSKESLPPTNMMGTSEDTGGRGSERQRERKREREGERERERERVRDRE